MSSALPILEQQGVTGEVSAAASLSTTDTAVEPKNSPEDAGEAGRTSACDPRKLRQEDLDVCGARQGEGGDIPAPEGQLPSDEKVELTSGSELPGEHHPDEKVEKAEPRSASALAEYHRAAHQDAADTDHTDGSDGKDSGSSYTTYDFGPVRSTLSTIPELSMWDVPLNRHPAAAPATPATPANSTISAVKPSKAPMVDHAAHEAIQYHEQLLSEAAAAILDLQRRQTTLHQSLRALERSFDSFESLEERWIAAHAELLRDKEHSMRSQSETRSDFGQLREPAPQGNGHVAPTPPPASESGASDEEPPLDPLEEAFGEGSGIVFWPIFILATIGLWVILNDILAALRTYRLPFRHNRETDLLLQAFDACRSDVLESMRAMYDRLQQLERRIASQPSEASLASLALAHERDQSLGPGFFIAVVAVVLAIRHLLR